jgi:CRP/FNR family transcriptional regulator
MRYVRLLNENNEGASVEIVSGEVFGKIPNSGEHIFPFFLEALDDVEIWVLSKADFQRFFIKEAKGRSFSSYSGMLKRRKLENNIWLLLYTDIPERVASLLLDFARQFGKESKGGLLLGIKLSPQNLAHLTGTMPSFVLLALAGFINRGHIEIVKNRIVIKNQEALKSLARRGLNNMEL